MLKQSVFVLLLVAITSYTSCTDENVDPDETPNVGSEGYFITNEGAWGNGNASLSFYDRESGEVTNDVFYTANSNRALGDQAQSMALHDSLGYIVVQNSGKIEVIHADNFTSVTTISEGIESPRFFIAISQTKGYVSDWGADGISGSVKVIDLVTHEVTKTIPTGQGADQMLMSESRLYVVNAGGWGRDQTVAIIDPATDEVLDHLTVADNPNSLQSDSEGNIWVLSGGHTAYNENWEVVLEESTFGALAKISPSGTVMESFTFSEYSSPSDLIISNDGETLYFSYMGAVYSMSTSDQELPSTPFIDKSYYGLAIDPFDGTIIGCEAPDFTTSGSIDIYSAEGELLETHSVGIGPNSITFK